MYGHTKKAHLRDYFITAFLFVLLFWAFAIRHDALMLSESTVTINDAAFSVELAQTEAERELGLSGRDVLPQGKGMLFVFSHPDRRGFWMRNMRFAIDIVWIDSNWRIVDIAKNISPDSYPRIFMPPALAQYVLEIPAGSATRYGWKVGDEVKFEQSLRQ